MTPQLTLGVVRPIVARRLNLCSTDLRIVSYINEAQRRLMAKGQWKGTMQLYRFCIGDDACIVWPRQFEAIEGYALCTAPGTIRNRWYQFAGQGPGQLSSEDDWFNQLQMQDDACAFAEIGTDTNTKKIQVSTVLPESAGLEILLQGYDENAQWIRTLRNGAYVEGEYVSISSVPQLTTRYFTKLVAVQKPRTNGSVILSEYETAGGVGVVKVLAQYESDETLPSYRTSLLPGIANMSGCGTSSSDCTTKQVTVYAKLRHIDVTNDTDWLILTSADAIASMCQAIYREENNLDVEAMRAEARAVRILEEELNAYEGDGPLPVLTSEDRATYGAGVVGPIAAPYPYFY